MLHPGVRGGSAAGRHLEWKVRIFSAGAVLALVGIYLGKSWVTLLAIVVLVAGAGLRFLPAVAPDELDEGDDPPPPQDF